MMIEKLLQNEVVMKATTLFRASYRDLAFRTLQNVTAPSCAQGYFVFTGPIDPGLVTNAMQCVLYIR